MERFLQRVERRALGDGLVGVVALGLHVELGHQPVCTCGIRVAPPTRMILSNFVCPLARASASISCVSSMVRSSRCLVISSNLARSSSTRPACPRG